jgi:hypothetical protein
VRTFSDSVTGALCTRAVGLATGCAITARRALQLGHGHVVRHPVKPRARLARAWVVAKQSARLGECLIDDRAGPLVADKLTTVPDERAPIAPHDRLERFRATIEPEAGKALVALHAKRRPPNRAQHARALFVGCRCHLLNWPRAGSCRYGRPRNDRGDFRPLQRLGARF